ncbi:hypothetical protein [Formivibrio citricus]|uniref:hypothetical protein n=1 Tax=Formivibrio citricus TaxID=83765 RepID=UPI0011606EC7|nr:hypothetical protein [Formivibrio citricus]
MGAIWTKIAQILIHSFAIRKYWCGVYRKFVYSMLWYLQRRWIVCADENGFRLADVAEAVWLVAGKVIAGGVI